MKTVLIKLLFVSIVILFSRDLMAQTAKKQSSKGKNTSASASKSPAVDVTVKLTSKCERNLLIFAGPKEQLRDPKVKEVGGLSVNTFHLKTGNAICIMDAKKKPISCFIMTKSSSQLEINSAGTVISFP
jgi:hypothetical protein